MTPDETKRLFAALRAEFGPLTQANVDAVNAALSGAEAQGGAPTGSQQRISPKGLALVKRSEGLRLSAYRCPAGIPTIGYGSTGDHVRMGMTITEPEAERLLREDLDRFERGVSRLVGQVPQGQFDALVSFAFNVGLKALEGSTLLRRHKAGDFAGAAAQFAAWNKGGGKVLPGLVTRRADERALYEGRA